ncbi:MAG: hypothetical protein HZB16_02945 [Armatimonadetes bacterium]|nr:hypothetical protein [Armatimonadota bacterium]
MATVSAKLPGARRALVPDFDVPLPPEFWRGDGAVRLRDLIAVIVRWEVIAFQTRAEARRLHRALTAQQIAEGAERGKVDSGGRDLEQCVTEEQAVGTAWQCFEDGIYLVFIDGAQQHRLDDQVFVRADSTILFVRLVMLAGA